MGGEPSATLTRNQSGWRTTRRHTSNRGPDGEAWQSRNAGTPDQGCGGGRQSRDACSPALRSVLRGRVRYDPLEVNVLCQRRVRAERWPVGDLEHGALLGCRGASRRAEPWFTTES